TRTLTPCRTFARDRAHFAEGFPVYAIGGLGSIGPGLFRLSRTPVITRVCTESRAKPSGFPQLFPQLWKTPAAGRRVAGKQANLPQLDRPHNDFCPTSR